MPAGSRRSRPPLPRYAVAWFPEFDGIERIEAFRLRHDPVANVIPVNNEFLFLMAARGAASVTGLHDKLYTRSLQPHLRRDLPYEPHITLARCAEFERLEAAFAEADDEFADELGGVIREVALLRVEGDGRISPLKRIDLNTT